MRSNSALGIVLGALFGVFCCLPASHGQTITGIFEYDNYWRYDQSATNPPANWREVNFDDSAWSYGPGLLGWPQDEPLSPFPFPSDPPIIWTLLNITNNGRFTYTYYFRTAFAFPTNVTTNNIVLVLSNVLDDGAVFYLNGGQLGRIAMTNAVINHTTLASRQNDVQDASHGIDVAHFGPTNLVRGTNILAVEVHQGGAPSSDILFGTTLGWYRGTPAAITLNPPATTFVPCAGVSVSLAVRAAGSELSYLWYSNNVYMPNQVGPIMRLDSITTSANGASFYVIVSNALNSVRSITNVLTVLPDQCGPRVLLAESRDLERGTNEIRVTYDEDVSPRNTNHYRVVAMTNAGPQIRVTNVWFVSNLVSGTLRPVSNMHRVFLNQPLDRTTNYMLIVNGVTDPRNNVIAPNTTVPVMFKELTNIFSAGDLWKFNDIEYEPPAFDNTWTNLTFNDGGWAEGSALFVRDNFRAATCSPDGTALGYGPTTIYFRKRFPYLGTIGSRMELIFQNQIDDGAVIYLNGIDVLRVRMPSGPISYSTRPVPPTTGEYGCTTNIVDVDGSVVRRGVNILAVELHNVATDQPGDNDALFDLGLTFGTHTGPTLQRPPRPSLSITRTAQNIRLAWQTNGVGTNSGYILEFANHIGTNIWREVQPNMANPYTAPAAGAARFYRLRWED